MNQLQKKKPTVVYQATSFKVMSSYLKETVVTIAIFGVLNTMLLMKIRSNSEVTTIGTFSRKF